MPRHLRPLLLTAAVMTAAGFVWTGAQSLTTYNLTLSHADVTTDPGGRLVVTMASRGDLPGMLTLGLTRDASGAVTGGEWALVVSYTTLTGPDGHVDVASLDHDEEEDAVPHSEALVQKGVLKGDISAGALTLNPDGSLGSLNLALVLSGGTLQFDGATTGNGVVSVDNLGDREASTGAASVLF